MGSSLRVTSLSAGHNVPLLKNTSSSVLRDVSNAIASRTLDEPIAFFCVWGSPFVSAICPVAVAVCAIVVCVIVVWL